MKWWAGMKMIQHNAPHDKKHPPAWIFYVKVFFWFTQIERQKIQEFTWNSRIHGCQRFGTHARIFFDLVTHLCLGTKSPQNRSKKTVKPAPSPTTHKSRKMVVHIDTHSRPLVPTRAERSRRRGACGRPGHPLPAAPVPWHGRRRGKGMLGNKSAGRGWVQFGGGGGSLRVGGWFKGGSPTPPALNQLPVQAWAGTSKCVTVKCVEIYRFQNISLYLFMFAQHHFEPV